MQFNLDWAYLKPATLTTVITLLLGSSLLAFSFNYLIEAEEQLNTTERKLSSLTSKYRKTLRDKELINNFLTPYQRLQQRGIAGKENRLNWVDTLRASVQALQVPRMYFQFAPQQIFKNGIIDASSKLKVYSSRMKLDVGLLHEIDLLRLLDDLERQIPSMFTIDSCSIDLIGKEFGYVAEQPNLNINCELLWFTIDLGSQTVITEIGP